jgi:hypothetical protein
MCAPPLVKSSILFSSERLSAAIFSRKAFIRAEASGEVDEDELASEGEGVAVASLLTITAADLVEEGRRDLDTTELMMVVLSIMLTRG